MSWINSVVQHVVHVHVVKVVVLYCTTYTCNYIHVIQIHIHVHVHVHAFCTYIYNVHCIDNCHKYMYRKPHDTVCAQYLFYVTNMYITAHVPDWLLYIVMLLTSSEFVQKQTFIYINQLPVYQVLATCG